MCVFGHDLVPPMVHWPIKDAYPKICRFHDKLKENGKVQI